MLGNQVLESVTMEQDLGILIQDYLNVLKQCTKVVKTCDRILSMIKRSFSLSHLSDSSPSANAPPGLIEMQLCVSWIAVCLSLLNIQGVFSPLTCRS